MALFMKKTKKLESEINRYLDLVINGGIIFKQGIKFYLNNELDLFEERLAESDKCETNADELRRSIEEQLYEHMLIPEHRGDVLGILESTDKVLNISSETLYQFSVESPKIPEDLKDYFIELVDASANAIEAMISAIRLYFHYSESIRDNITKVMRYEKEADKISDKLKRKVFQRKDIDLADKMHIRYFAYHIENVADAAEDVCDRLAIASIKRSI